MIKDFKTLLSYMSDLEEFVFSIEYNTSKFAQCGGTCHSVGKPEYVDD